jgi:hypothetical protein
MAAARDSWQNRRDRVRHQFDGGRMDDQAADDHGSPTANRRWWPAAVCCCAYVVLAMLSFGHLGSLGKSHMSGTGSLDAIVQVWWLSWAASALPHGYNIFAATWLNYPAGQNFGVQGSMLALGVALMPITKLFGPVVAWNLVVRLAVAASAISMCLVLRRWVSWWPANFLGGLLYGFSAYMTWNGDGVYLFLIFVPLPPVFFLLLHEILVRQRWRPVLTGVLLGLVCTLQFFIFTEVLAGMVVMGTIAIVLYVLADHRAAVRRWRYAAIALASGIASAGLLLFYPALFTFAGPEHINGSPFSPGLLQLFPGDLLSPILPNGELLDPKVVAITGPSLGLGGALYLGLPLILALALFAVFFRKRRVILFAGMMALIAYVLSLGSRLWFDGHITSIPLPFAVFTHLPAIQGLLAARLSLFTALFAAGMFAVGIDELRRRLLLSDRVAWLSRRSEVGARVVLVALGMIVILPLVPGHTHPASRTTPPNVPSFFTSSAVNVIPAQSVVLAYPYPDLQSSGLISVYFPSENAMLDQAVSGMRFKLIGGYGWFPSPTGRFGTVGPALLQPQSVQALFDVAFDRGTPAEQVLLSKSNITADLRVFLRRFHVDTVMIIDQIGDTASIVSHVTAAIGPPVQSAGVTLWLHVQHRLAAAPRP